MRRTWTADDEAAFKKLAAERERLVAQQREPVKTAVHWMLLDIQRTLEADVGLGSATARERLIDALIARAATVRAALEPFDDGLVDAQEQPSC